MLGAYWFTSPETVAEYEVKCKNLAVKSQNTIFFYFDYMPIS